MLAATLSVAGCAVSSAPSTPHVSLNISAPTSGATVGVHQVTVMGTVVPLTAAVSVNGHPAHVAGGVYKQTLWVSSANQQISVVGAAHGYAPANATTTISYSPNVAAQLMASSQSLKSAPASVTSRVSPAATSAIDGLFNVSSPSTGSGSPAGGSGSSPSNGSGGSGAGGGGAGGSTTPTTPSGGSPTGAPSSGGTSSKPTAPPQPTPAQIAAAIRKAWVHDCIPHKKGENVVPYCSCTYTQLQHHNLLSTRQGVARLDKLLKPYLRTGNFTKLPRFLRHAVNVCISKYPPLDPMKGRPKVTALPGGSQPGQGASNQPVAPSPSGPSTPYPPAGTGGTTSTGTTSTGTTTGSTSQTGTTSPGG